MTRPDNRDIDKELEDVIAHAADARISVMPRLQLIKNMAYALLEARKALRRMDRSWGYFASSSAEPALEIMKTIKDALDVDPFNIAEENRIRERPDYPYAYEYATRPDSEHHMNYEEWMVSKMRGMNDEEREAYRRIIDRTFTPTDTTLIRLVRELRDMQNYHAEHATVSGYCVSDEFADGLIHVESAVDRWLAEHGE